MLLKYFDAYVNAGFKPIALSPYTKKPIEPNWNKKWSSSRWRKHFESDVYNIGILLGNVIDVEADCERSNDMLDDLLKNHRHIKFHSFRSTHHLFLNDDNKFRFLKVNGIEFRGYGLHSVVPPSWHQNGFQYKFAIDNYFSLTYMPDNLKKIFHDNFSTKSNKNKYLYKKNIVYKNNCKTTCKKCGEQKFINRKRLSCEVKIFLNMNSNWLCHKCRDFSITKLVRKNLN